MKPQPWPGDPNDPEGLSVWVRRFLEHLRVRHYSEVTVHAMDGHLRMFLQWALDRGLSRPSEITKPMLESYQRWLFYYRKPSGKPLSYGTQRHRLTLLKGLFRWLARENVILWNPAGELDIPRKEHRLPKAILSEREMERVLSQPDVTDALGLRDRAMMELLYSTGVRRAELARLSVFDVDQDRHTVTVRQGKGRRDRLVPIGERALFWFARYLDEVRPELAVLPDLGTAFLTEHGEPLSHSRLSILMREYLRKAKTGKEGAVHIFRHSMATHLLDAGADIRAIQEMLGHAKLETTQLYTQVSIDRLKAVHAACHPTAKLEPRHDRAPAPPAPLDADSAAPPSASDLLSALEAERADERRESD